MYYINEITTNQIIINKSKFITTIIPIQNIEEANLNLTELRKKYFDATHNCYAYVIGDNYEIQKQSDDGEPQKTAGFPILDMIKKLNITNVLVVVTRYFGGTLLGASGLIKAYSESAKLAILKANLYLKETLLETTIPFNYKEYNQIKNLSYLIIINEVFSADVLTTILIKEIDKNKLIDYLENILKYKLDNINFKQVTTFIKA